MMLLILETTLVACSNQPTKEPLTSLCFMDFAAETCWIDKSKNDGISFERMQIEQVGCHDGMSSCWYGIDQMDLNKIEQSLAK